MCCSVHRHSLSVPACLLKPVNTERFFNNKLCSSVIAYCFRVSSHLPGDWLFISEMAATTRLQKETLTGCWGCRAKTKVGTPASSYPAATESAKANLLLFTLLAF